MSWILMKIHKWKNKDHEIKSYKTQKQYKSTFGCVGGKPIETTSYYCSCGKNFY